ncbi:fibropellin-1-like [Saccostrea cucullata]|uniref:fibropellin-1-like n=1 Tax=Saccostrea cuccullata TaxID=36930 RepID=UPI002ED24D26
MNITSPCLGNGRCLNTQGSFKCTCDSGWEGPRCSVKVKLFCNQIPCKNNGTCILNLTTQNYQCICSKGFEGDFCDIDINECVTSFRPCSGRGSCVNSFGSYFCDCYGDWEGLRCEKRIDPCLSNPCPKNSVCETKGSSYQCTCNIGWEGPKCDQEVKRATGPCANMCKGEESCYLEHDCTHYKHCHARNFACHCTLMKCAFGTFWSSSLNTCDKVSNVLCKSDPCLNLPADSTYPSEFNCRTFYMCNRNMQSIAMCCDLGYAYDPEVKNCTRSRYCSLECSTQNIPTTTSPTVVETSPPWVTSEGSVCKLYPLNGDPTKFIQSGLIQSCAKGTIFQPSICGCGSDKDYILSRCSSLVYLDFRGDRIKDVYHQSYVEVKNVMRINTSEPDDTYAFFNGRSSSIRIPRFSAVALRLLTIQIRFFALPFGPRYQVLISNCRSSAKPTGIIELQNQTPSVAIVADTKDEHLTLLGYSEDWRVRPAILTLSYKVKAWMNVELLYDGRSIAGRVTSFSSNGSISFESKDETVLSGNLVAPDGPLSIGMCKENQDAFYGYMDMVQVFDCNP